MARSDSGGQPRAIPASALVRRRILSRVDACLADSAKAERLVAVARERLPAEVLANVAAVESLPRMQPASNRDALLIQLGFGFEAGDGFDHTIRAEGARTAGGTLGAAFKERQRLSGDTYDLPPSRRDRQSPDQPSRHRRAAEPAARLG